MTADQQFPAQRQTAANAAGAHTAASSTGAANLTASNTRADGQPLGVDHFGRVHMVGIGGAGMSVVARLLAARAREGVPGLRVQGCDAALGPAALALAQEGIEVYAGHGASHVVDASGAVLVDTLVVSSAIKESNPDLRAARDHKVQVLHRSQALASVMAQTTGVAVAGAHGKTTTSAMLATVLRVMGADPSFAIGGVLRQLAADGSVEVIPGGHLGTGPVLVAEADESDGSFLNYRPTYSLVLNVEPDHLDHYGSAEAFEQAFDAFAHRIVPGGALIACADDPGAARTAARYAASGGQAYTYGTGALRESDQPETESGAVRPDTEPDTARLGIARHVVIDQIVTSAQGSSARLTGGPLGLDPVTITLTVPGVHNLLNATAAVMTAALITGQAQQAAAAISHFGGTGRRFELRGTVQVHGAHHQGVQARERQAQKAQTQPLQTQLVHAQETQASAVGEAQGSTACPQRAASIRVVDDYAHHPTEVEALLKAARTFAGPGRVLVLFQPHLFSRTRTFARQFAQALSLADAVVVTGIYPARELAADFPDVTATTITDLMDGQGWAIEDRMQAARHIAGLAQPSDVVFTVGAGDVTNLAQDIVTIVQARWDTDASLRSDSDSGCHGDAGSHGDPHTHGASGNCCTSGSHGAQVVS